MLYVDTGCLLKLYYPEWNSAEVAAAFFALEGKQYDAAEELFTAEVAENAEKNT